MFSYTIDIFVQILHNNISEKKKQVYKTKYKEF